MTGSEEKNTTLLGLEWYLTGCRDENERGSDLTGTGQLEIHSRDKGKF